MGISQVPSCPSRQKAGMCGRADGTGPGSRALSTHSFQRTGGLPSPQGLPEPSPAQGPLVTSLRAAGLLQAAFPAHTPLLAPEGSGEQEWGPYSHRAWGMPAPRQP